VPVTPAIAVGVGAAIATGHASANGIMQIAASIGG
jgi:hypothetical protein